MRRILVRVELAALITTHGSDDYGCCEFLPTKHTFTVNGVDFGWSFDDAGTAWGCSDKAGQGSEPNEYGTWWYGRGNWCDGMDVKPLVVDVTSAVMGGVGGVRGVGGVGGVGGPVDGRVVVSYSGLMMSMAAYESSGEIVWVPPQSDGASGYVIMSSHLVYYYADKEEGQVESSGSVGWGGMPANSTDSADDASVHRRRRRNDDEQANNDTEGVGASVGVGDLIAVSLATDPRVLYWLIGDGVLHLVALGLIVYFKGWRLCGRQAYMHVQEQSAHVGGSVDNVHNSHNIHSSRSSHNCDTAVRANPLHAPLRGDGGGGDVAVSL